MYSPEIVLNISSEEINVKPRKLKAVWSHEAQEDLLAMHNVCVEKELTDILAKEIQAEIDKEILNDLINAAGGPPSYAPPYYETIEEVVPAKKKKPKYRDITSDWEVQIDSSPSN